MQRRLASGNHCIPIIFISAHENQEVRNQAMRSGAVDFLPKPFSEESLLRAIRAALQFARWPTSARLPDPEHLLPLRMSRD